MFLLIDLIKCRLLCKIYTIMKIFFFTISTFGKNLVSEFPVHFMIIFLSFLIFRFEKCL